MCINLKTSIAAFLIGQIAGLMLAFDSNKRPIGFFIMFFSLVQLFEALIYAGYDKYGIVSKLLLTNLALQGLFFFYVMKQYNVYMLLCIIISIMVISAVFKKDFKPASNDKCLKWDFMDSQYSNALTLMYILILYYLVSNKNTFYRKFGYLLLFTCVISYACMNIYKSPSFWCLTSAIASPIALWFF